MRRRHHKPFNQSSKILAGLFVVFFGSVFLAQQSGVAIPHGLLSWKSILISVGIVSLVRHGFNSFTGYAMIAIGSAFLLDDYYPQWIDAKLILPILVIAFGIGMLGRALNLFGSKKKRSRRHVMFDEEVDITGDDFIEATAMFGGVKKNVTSQNFRGADISTTFGGAEINLTKADIQQPITINTRTTFGGTTLIIPSHWQVHSEVSAVFGAVEDQRGIIDTTQVDENKVITLEGSCVFGGVEIKSYV